MAPGTIRKAVRIWAFLFLVSGALWMSGCRRTGRKVRLFFIGNSHTYVHDVPSLVGEKAAADGYSCEIACAAEPDYYLRDHLADQETAGILKKGGFDFVILQEHADPFPEQQEYEDSVKAVMDLVPDSGCRFILYECWAKKKHGKTQKKMCRVNEAVAGNTGAALAEVGRIWKETMDADPNAGLYGKDHEHASAKGADLAARVLWDTIRGELEKSNE